MTQKRKFKVGDRVVCHNYDLFSQILREPVRGVITKIGSNGIYIKPDIFGKCSAWSFKYTILEHVYDSPLNKALR